MTTCAPVSPHVPTLRIRTGSHFNFHSHHTTVLLKMTTKLLSGLAEDMKRLKTLTHFGTDAAAPISVPSVTVPEADSNQQQDLDLQLVSEQNGLLEALLKAHSDQQQRIVTSTKAFAEYKSHAKEQHSRETKNWLTKTQALVAQVGKLDTQLKLSQERYDSHVLELQISNGAKVAELEKRVQEMKTANRNSLENPGAMSANNKASFEIMRQRMRYQEGRIKELEELLKETPPKQAQSRRRPKAK